MSGGGVNAGLREQDADSSSTHYVNSHLAAESFTSTSDTLRVVGAVVAADAVTVDTGKLYVVSLQDEAHSKSKSQGIHGGISLDSSGGVSGGSIGADFQKSTSARKWVEEQSGIIGHDSIAITAQDTTLTGGLIATAAYDENGQLIDQGNLQLRTDTLTVNDLHDVDKNKTVGGSIGISLSGASADQSKGTASNAPLKNGDAGKEPVPHNTTTVGATYLGHVTEQTTHATLGNGTVIVGNKILDDSYTINRDLSNAQEITKDQDIGGLNATVTVDNRWFSEAGRADMAQQQKQAIDGVETLLVSTVSGFKEGINAALEAKRDAVRWNEHITTEEVEAYWGAIDQELKAQGTSLDAVRAALDEEAVNSNLNPSEVLTAAKVALSDAVDEVYLKKINVLFEQAGATKDQVIAVIKQADGQYRVINRLTGAVGVLTDSGEILTAHVAGMALSIPSAGVSEGAAVAFTVLKADDFSANMMTMITGESVPTLKERMLVAAGAGDSAGMLSGMLTLNVGGTTRHVITNQAGGVVKAASEVASSSNYRSLFLNARPDLPSGWQVHHSMPQKYEELMVTADINIHDMQFLRGVSPEMHSKITTEWARFDRSVGGSPTAAQVAEFAKSIDEKFGGGFVWPGH